jgi:hypothetical protein
VGYSAEPDFSALSNEFVHFQTIRDRGGIPPPLNVSPVILGSVGPFNGLDVVKPAGDQFTVGISTPRSYSSKKCQLG